MPTACGQGNGWWFVRGSVRPPFICAEWRPLTRLDAALPRRIAFRFAESFHPATIGNEPRRAIAPPRSSRIISSTAKGPPSPSARPHTRRPEPSSLVRRADHRRCSEPAPGRFRRLRLLARSSYDGQFGPAVASIGVEAYRSGILADRLGALSLRLRRPTIIRADRPQAAMVGCRLREPARS
jgi:hypothetical protein